MSNQNAKLARVEEGLRVGVTHAIQSCREYMLAVHFLACHKEDRCRNVANYIRQKMIPDGGWAIYEGGPAEVSASAKAYFVLKLLGDSPDAPHRKKAREVICSLGGLDAA